MQSRREFLAIFKTKVPQIIHESPVNSTAKILMQVFAKIAVKGGVPPSYCEELSCFLNQAYSTRNRAFHNIRHAHEVAAVTSASATAQLAALFHDVVYIQVDWARRPDVRKLFEPFEVVGVQKLVIPHDLKNWERALVTVFGFEEGQEVPLFGGLNEFLSAWVTIQKLQGKISTLKLLKVIACIEATIPFWVSKINLNELPTKLGRNLQMAAEQLGIKLPEGFVDEAIHEGVEIANQDVIGFASDGPRKFLFNTWSLLSESNSTLQGPLYTVSQYKEAISKTANFISNLKPDLIFRSYKDSPDSREMEQLRKGAERNLKIGSEYIFLRLVEISIIEALALLTGGDAPLEMFVGPRATRREVNTDSIDKYLNNKIRPSSKINKTQEISELLSRKRPFRSSLDIKGAPISAFLFEKMTRDELEQAFNSVKKYSAKGLSPIEFLGSFSPDLVSAIIDATGKIAVTREYQLRILSKNIKYSHSKIKPGAA